ncbi:Bacteriophage tail assembly protein [Thalassovita gelatinovora]|uniref:Bacteriophage tail assembly protein n=1 Tax=Thalassovita gelatinovora TaxID=53501 RepID=A0A0N7LVN9_THAGE|nr:terminase gpA endonuclease subunit [Thalassovita gelatinovora]QIZ79787.1 terminase [Thalassovita gelatinovora]CUH66826.1 Bacteriophage tail assembly protein [Thalassovita gelatinovora]SEQ43444.1 Phage terminase, large subunit GpA [Thalassovita gelatinovora]
MQMPDRPAGKLPELPPLPPFASARDVLRRCLPSLLPATRMSVVEAAIKHMKVNANGRWVAFDPDVTPMMVEPANMLASRFYREWVFVGPARTGKTVMLLKGTAHAITCDPGVVHITHMTEGTAEKWVDEELLPMIENSPELAKRQGTGRSDRNILSKKFVGGTKVTIGPPTKANLSGRTIRTVLFTDLDRMPLTVGKEGTPFTMGAKRNETLGSRGMTAAESSPGHPITDPEWVPSTPHEAPPAAGIVDLYNGGTRGRWYWDCPCCGEPFQPLFELLEYDETLLPAEAGAQAYMVCPHEGCGGVIEAGQKVTLNRSGYWLHETAEGGLARIDSGEVLKSERISWMMNGAAASFASWARLVSKYETARRALKATGDEEPLKVTINTDQGMPYLPMALKVEAALTIADLKADRLKIPQKVAPSWTRFLVVSVDVQKGRFVVQVMAYGLDGQRVPIDRFDLHTPPPTAPRASDRMLEPEKYIEDWEVLRPLLTSAYPVEGADHGLTPLAVACDFHGQPGVSDKANQFWDARVADGERDKWFFIRGHGGFKVDGRIWYKQPTRANSGEKARSIWLLNIATDKLKDTLFAALSRVEGGPGSQRVPEWMGDDHLKEFTAEHRKPTGYEKRKNMPRNEAIDLSSYAQALAEHKGLKRLTSQAALPDWALSGLANSNAVPLETDGTPVPEAERPERVEQPVVTRIGYLE